MSIDNILPNYSFLNPIKDHLTYMANVNDSVSIFIAQMLESYVRSKEAINDAETAVASMLRQIIVYQDSITPLITYGKADAIEIVMRTNLELMAQLLFMTSNDIEIKGRLYLYYLNAKEHHLINKIINSPDNEAFKNELGINLDQVNPEHLEYFRKKYNLIAKIIDPESLENLLIKDRINNFKPNKSWFYMYDTKLGTIESVFRSVNWHHLYKGGYRIFSTRTHSSNVVAGRLDLKDNSEIAFFDARFPFDIHSIVYTHLIITTKFLFQFTEVYFRNYFEIFKKKYKDDFGNKFKVITTFGFTNGAQQNKI